MCTLRYGFRLCTCAAFEGRADWTLYRRIGFRTIDGMFFFADEWPDANRQTPYLLKHLADPDTFDWAYEPVDGDSLVLRDAVGNELWAVFEAGSWRRSWRDPQVIEEESRGGSYFVYSKVPGPVMPVQGGLEGEEAYLDADG